MTALQPDHQQSPILHQQQTCDDEQHFLSERRPTKTTTNPTSTFCRSTKATAPSSSIADTKSTNPTSGNRETDHAPRAPSSSTSQRQNTNDFKQNQGFTKEEEHSTEDVEMHQSIDEGMMNLRSMNHNEEDKKKGTKHIDNEAMGKPKADKECALIKASDVGPYDVLCGRDKATFNYVGNRRFRVTINLYIPKYAEARTKREKAAVIVSLVRTLRDEVGTRFLKLYEPKGAGKHDTEDTAEDVYLEMDEAQSRKKVGHALRDMSVARHQQSTKHAASASKKSRRRSDASMFEDPTAYGLDRSRRKSDIMVEDGVANDDSGQAVLENSFSEESFSDSMSSMLPFVGHSNQEGTDTSMEPLPVFSQQPAERLPYIQHKHQQQQPQMMSPPQPPLPFAQPSLPPTLTAGAVHPYAYHHSPVAHALPPHQYQSLPQQPLPHLPIYSLPLQPQLPHTHPNASQQRNDLLDYQQHFYHLHHHYHHHLHGGEDDGEDKAP